MASSLSFHSSFHGILGLNGELHNLTKNTQSCPLYILPFMFKIHVARSVPVCTYWLYDVILH